MFAKFTLKEALATASSLFAAQQMPEFITSQCRISKTDSKPLSGAADDVEAD